MIRIDHHVSLPHYWQELSRVLRQNAKIGIVRVDLSRCSQSTKCNVHRSLYCCIVSIVYMNRLNNSRQKRVGPDHSISFPTTRVYWVPVRFTATTSIPTIHSVPTSTAMRRVVLVTGKQETKTGQTGLQTIMFFNPFKISMQPHQKQNVTQYEELSVS